MSTDTQQTDMIFSSRRQCVWFNLIVVCRFQMVWEQYPDWCSWGCTHSTTSRLTGTRTIVLRKRSSTTRPNSSMHASLIILDERLLLVIPLHLFNLMLHSLIYVIPIITTSIHILPSFAFYYYICKLILS